MFRIGTDYASLASMPWSVKTKENLDIENALNILDKYHHGSDEIKKRILGKCAFVNVMNRKIIFRYYNSYTNIKYIVLYTYYIIFLIFIIH